MKEMFVTKNFTAHSLAIISQANEILIEYEDQGFDLSLRQLYYQFVARGYIENSQRSYKNLGGIIADARLAGLIDWDTIKDRGRRAVTLNHWSNPADALDTIAKYFHIDKWQYQSSHIWIMVEKQALEGVLIPICQELDVTFIANKGYSSASTMYETGKIFENDDRDPIVFYLGDHDPSGIDMTRDVQERLEMFAGRCVEVKRLALNMDQIEQYNPPPNPAKETDARFGNYVDKFGETCWELDALNPTTLAALIRDAIAEYRDDDAWNEAVQREDGMRDQLLKYAASYRRNHRKAN